MKTTSKKKDDLKNEDGLKNEDDLNNEEDLNNQNNLKKGDISRWLVKYISDLLQVVRSIA